MAALTKRATAVIGTPTGTTWAATANAVDGAVGSNPATYATWTNATSSAVGTIELGTFDFSSIPATATISSVQMLVRHFENTTSRFTSLTGVLYDGATVIGTPQTCTLSASAATATITSSVIPTLAQLQSSTFKCRLTVTHAANTQSAILSIDQVDITVNYTLPPVSISTLVDTFDTQIDKATVWVGSSAVTVWDASGRAKLPCAATYSLLATDGAGSYDLTASSIYAQITPATGGTGSRETFLEIIRGGVSNDKMSMFVSGADLYGRKTVGGATIDQLSTPYNATTHAWWRIRESGGTVYFDFSSDGASWTNHWSATPGFDISRVWVNISSGYWGTESAADTFVDNVNTVPGAAVLIPPRISVSNPALVRSFTM